jgi:hypothetical protein
MSARRESCPLHAFSNNASGGRFRAGKILVAHCASDRDTSCRRSARRGPKGKLSTDGFIRRAVVRYRTTVGSCGGAGRRTCGADVVGVSAETVERIAAPSSPHTPAQTHSAVSARVRCRPSRRGCPGRGTQLKAAPCAVRVASRRKPRSDWSRRQSKDDFAPRAPMHKSVAWKATVEVHTLCEIGMRAISRRGSPSDSLP